MTRDLIYVAIQGQEYVIVACSNKLVIYLISPTQLVKQLECVLDPCQDVLKFVQTSEDYLVCALQNGQYLGWKLTVSPVNFDHALGLDEQR